YEIVKSENDRNTPLNPYFYLRSEEFWVHVPTQGNETAVEALSSPPSIGKLPQLIAGAQLDPDLWNLMLDKDTRTRLHDVLISRYFPQYRDILLHPQMAVPIIKEDKEEYQAPGRSAGFRRIVVQVYEHQCAACGLRLRRPDGATIVDAAHIIPFSESHNDHPRNGLALCKNHHWAMDRSLIAPSPDYLWLVSKELDSRQAGEMELMSLANRPLILPKEKAYHPLPEALEWRELRLA
ncbi:MAG: HNH endonuclease, partial [Akkermansiaceae bacterium]|nr:HNH endonuclease [Akkermansiaceae bacterium]